MEKIKLKVFLVELIGTFFLCFCGGCSVFAAGNIGGVSLMNVACAHGIILYFMISWGGSISGGQYNPAVTIALGATKLMSWDSVIQYLIAQFSGSFIAGFMLDLALPDPTVLNKITGTSPQVTDSVNKFQGCLLEFIATFTLVLVVFTGIRLKLSEHQIGMYVGVVLTTFICCIGGYTGASLNPARTLGPYMVAHNFIPLDFVKQPFVVYYVSPILGGLAAGFLSKYVLHSDASLHEINSSKGEVDANSEKML